MISSVVERVVYIHYDSSSILLSLNQRSFYMYLLIVFLPIIGSFVSGFFGRFVGRKGAVLISTGCTMTSSFFSVLCFYEVGLCSCPCYLHLASWMSCEMFDASWGFLFDSLTSIMCIVVTGVSSLVHIYSISYMSEDPHLSRFMSYLSFFTFCMLMLVTADNLIQVFFGWEGECGTWRPREQVRGEGFVVLRCVRCFD